MTKARLIRDPEIAWDVPISLCKEWSIRNGNSQEHLITNFRLIKVSNRYFAAIRNEDDKGSNWPMFLWADTCLVQFMRHDKMGRCVYYALPGQDDDFNEDAKINIPSENWA